MEKNHYGLTSFSLSFQETEAAIEVRYRDWSIRSSIGLDNGFRTTDLAENGTLAERGRWVDDHTFELDEQFLGSSSRNQTRFVFEGSRVEVTVKGLDSGSLNIFRGLLAP